MRMNNKGQFSIIAALLVAVILIGTVVSTYSAIRYSTTKDQPQVLSSVDEINLALKQLLGFTLGYYGSVLEVTGNTTYAQNITKTYLNSGLVNVANTKPELGVSFNVTSIELHVEWFGTESYSSGRLNVTYDLAGLGFYGLKYSPVCKLEVQISPSVSGEARLSVSQDEDEPLNTLTKQNFKFYRYLETETWNLTTPNSIEEVTLGGAYSITLPSGIDSNSYLVQVEDPRGIMVVASSFSHYTSTSTWSTTYSSIGDYVDQLSNVDGSADRGFHSGFNNQKTTDNINDVLAEQNAGANIEQFVTQTSNVDSLADKGSHSNFTAQRYGPDSTYDTLTETASGSIAKVGTATNGTGNSLSLSFSHTLVAGSNRIVVVCFGAEHSGITVSGVTYGGKAMTLAVSFETPETGTKFLSQIWYILEANLPGNGANTVTVTATGSTSGLEVNGLCSEYTGVTQGAPEATNGVSQTSGNTITNTLSPYTDAWVISAMGSGNSGSWTHGSSQVEVLDFNDASSSFAVAELRGANGQTSLSSTYSGTVNRLDRVSVSFTKVDCHLDLEAQWTNTDFSEANEMLCIYGGSMTSESLRVDVWTGSTWTPIIYNLQPNQWNNVSVASYLDNPTFTIRFKGNNETGDTTQDNWKIDCVLLHTWTVNYVLDLEEQFTGVDYSQLSEWLCIYAGSLGSESLRVDVRSGSNWVNVISGLLPNQWNNVSISTWLTSSSFTIRFNGGTETADTTQDSWNIDAVMLRLDSNYDFFSSLHDSTMTVEWLQNGTLRRLGQNLNLTTTVKPIPPFPVKAIHINQTFTDGTNREVPFQVEDWASNYSIPLGLTNNATVFSNKQMIVYLIDNTVTETTIWWNGSDQATQTNLAYTNTQFSSNSASRTLNNGRLALQLSASGFNVTSTVGGISSIASLMRINSESDDTDPEWAFVVTNGVVRDIVQGEAEYHDGAGTANNCPNLYSNIVLTLPAKTSYFTYQLRLMFLSSQQDRTINDLCPIKLTASFDTIQTEDGVSNKIPNVANGTGTYYNSGYPTTPGTAHHWSQGVTGSSGTGIMFTDSANQRLYSFDSFVGSATGAIKTTSGSTDTIELLPVTRSPANHFNNAFDITWCGSVATFSGSSTPIYNENGGNPTGLWVLVEYQPTIAVAAGT
jgi:hypothetical protein